MKKKVYQELAARVNAIQNCIKTGNTEWYDKHEEIVDRIIKQYMPHGSGIDGEYSIDYNDYEKLVIHSSFHRMDKNGMYIEWIDFRVVVLPSLMFGININIHGAFGKHQDLKNEYLHEIFDHALNEEVNEDILRNE